MNSLGSAGTAAVVAAVLLGGCGPDAGVLAAGDTPEAVIARPNEPEPARTDVHPLPWNSTLLTADVLVVGGDSLPPSVSNRVEKIEGVRLAIPLAIASIPVADRSITVAAVDATTFRRFTHERTARTEAVWQSLVRGEAIIAHQLGKDLKQRLGGSLALRAQHAGRPIRIGAYAATVPQVDAVVNEVRGAQLGMRNRNGMLVSVHSDKRRPALDAIRAALGSHARVQPLTPDVPLSGSGQAAYLTGGAVARAVGSFSYRYFDDGTVQPQASWVAENIRTEEVPILGKVTCHRVMLPQLRAALTEIVQRGLSEKIDPEAYGGCYVPRFIGRDPRRGLSLHTWGIALDVNVAGNQRGTAGEIDRTVVAIFKSWGFAWGGDWQWTDPMHFELAALVSR